MAFNGPSVSTPADGDEAVFTILATALAAGWSVPASSNGVVQDPVPDYASNGNLIASAADLAAAGAWFRLKMPGATRELLFVRKADSRSWTASYAVAGFLTGAPGVLTPPTGAGQQVPFDGTMLDADGSYRWLVAFDDAAPYEMWAAALTVGTLAATTGIALLAMEDGSCDVSEADPYAVIVTRAPVFANGQLWQSEQSIYKNFHGWWRYGTGAQAWRALPFGTVWFGQGNIGAESAIVDAGLLSSVEGQEVPVSILCGFRQGGYVGIKGRVRGARYVTSTTATAPNGTHLTEGANEWLRVGDLWLPWDATVPSL